MSCTPSAKEDHLDDDDDEYDQSLSNEFKDYLDGRYQKLDEKIERGAWKSNPNTLEQLFDTFACLMVALGGGYRRNIGTKEFWLAAYNLQEAYNALEPLEIYVQNMKICVEMYTTV